MITNFEDITAELNELELELIPILVEGFKTHTEANPIKAPQIVSNMNLYLVKKGKKIKMTEPRLRKCVNHIRSNSLLPLIATSKGYYVSNSRDVIEAQIKSLNERASSIKKCAEGLAFFVISP